MKKQKLKLAKPNHNIEKQSHSTQHDQIQCDLEYTRFKDEYLELEDEDFNAVEAAIKKIQKMTWQQVYTTSSKTEKRGLNWEVISNQRTASGAVIASIRITKKFRARVTRDGVYMRFVSLHPDHDSAYKERGGEDL